MYLLEVNPKGFIRLHSASEESLTVPYWASIVNMELLGFIWPLPFKTTPPGIEPGSFSSPGLKGLQWWQWASKGVIWPVWVSLGFFGLRSASFGLIRPHNSESH